MKSDLAKSVKGVDLTAQDDGFLATHLLAGRSELDELDELMTALKQRRSEAAAIYREVEKTLRSRHSAGKYLVVGKVVIIVPSESASGGITINSAEVLG